MTVVCPTPRRGEAARPSTTTSIRSRGLVALNTKGQIREVHLYVAAHDNLKRRIRKEP